MYSPDNGMFGAFTMMRARQLDQFLEAKKPDAQKENERAAIFNLDGPSFAVKSTAGNYGFGSMIERKQTIHSKTSLIL